MTQRDWTSETRTLGVFLNGREIRERTPHGEPLFGDTFLLVFNAHSEPVVFTLPTRRFGSRWQVELATGDAPEERIGARALVAVQEHSLVLLRRAGTRVAGKHRPSKPLSPAPSPQGIREDADRAGCARRSGRAQGGVRCNAYRTTSR